jgi:glutamyl-tRNA reductase
LFIVDIAVPRDVEPSVQDVPGIVLRDIDDLRGVVEASIGSRLSEVSKVEEVITDEVRSFVDWQRSSEISPTVSALVAWAETIRAAELGRVRDLELTDEQRAAVEKLTERIVSKLLHPPLNRAKELASSKQGHMYLTALRELFELDDEDV